MIVGWPAAGRLPGALVEHADGLWLERLGLPCDPAVASGLGDLANLFIHQDTELGRLSQFAPALELSETPPFWERPAALPGAHPAAWA